jgi:hypothetical protein
MCESAEENQMQCHAKDFVEMNRATENEMAAWRSR